MAQTIQLRRGTTAEWGFANPVLQAGELGYETSTNKLKIGTGVDRWTSLTYVSASADIADWSQLQNVPTVFPPDTANSTFVSYVDGRVSSGVSSHASLTQSVHGITDTSQIVYTTDSRLTDARDPTPHDHDERYTPTGSIAALSPVQSVAGKTGNVALAGEDIVSGTVADDRLSANVVFTTDSRLADSREWDAPTATSAEATAGVSTERRAWTAARVFEAASAWWSGYSDKTKLDGIEAGATANSPDATLLDRGNHTGTQAISTVTNLQTALDAKAPAGNYATLTDGVVTSSQLPDTDSISEGVSNLYHTAARAAASAPVQSVAGKTGSVALAGEDIVSGTLPDARLSANVVVEPDARLSDAREWSAETVGAAEAELGTGTTRRAWTAERVFQAIASWWSGSSDKAKLDGIEAGATANSADATLLDRGNHTGVQAISTVTSLQTTLDAKAPLASPVFSGQVGVGTAPQAPLHVLGSGTVGIFGTGASAFQFVAHSGGVAGILTIGSPTALRIGSGTAIPTEIAYGNQAVAQFVNTQSRLPSGSLSSGVFTPGITFLVDQDTGIGTAAANTISVCTGGVERVRVQDTGAFRLIPLSSDPTPGREGELYFNTVTQKLRLCTSSAWVDLN